MWTKSRCQSSTKPNQRTKLTNSGILLLFCSGCGAGHAHDHTAADQDVISETEGSSDDELTPAADPSLTPVETGEPEAPSAPIEEPEVTVARAALHRLPSTNNHLDLALTVAERTADLPWVLALENRSDHDVELAVLPELIQFDLVFAGASSDSASQTSPEVEPAPAKPIHCGLTLPTQLDSNETTTLPAHGMLVHAFDPRTLCADEDALQEGATVQLSFGFPLTTKKLWKGGKLTEVETEQVAPFLATRPKDDGDPVAGIKYLDAPPFVLGRTYPLRDIHARAEESDETAESPADVPPPPLQVKIFPLGTTKQPEAGLVRVQIQNTSQKPVLLHLRREALSYEVVGPAGSTTCRMLPNELSASQFSYTTLSPGHITNLSTRLAEACPKGVWDLPGTYTVAVRFAPTSSGEESNDRAYTGEISGENIATLIVPGTARPSMVQMLVVAQ